MALFDDIVNKFQTWMLSGGKTDNQFTYGMIKDHFQPMLHRDMIPNGMAEVAA
jgi:hypothetical protein